MNKINFIQDVNLAMDALNSLKRNLMMISFDEAKEQRMEGATIDQIVEVVRKTLEKPGAEASISHERPMLRQYRTDKTVIEPMGTMIMTITIRYKDAPMIEEV